MNFLGLDIGTTTIAACLCDEHGQVLYCVKEEHNCTIVGKSFEVMQDADALWNILACLLKGLPSTVHIDGIGIANQMHGIVYVCKDGNALSPLYTWQDARGAQTYGSTTYTQHAAELCGHCVPSGYGLMTHYYNVINGTVPSQTYRILDIGNFIACKMTGSIPLAIHPSEAHAFGFYIFHARCFDMQALKTLGIDCALLPEVQETSKPIGFWNDVSLYMPLGDNQAGFLGATTGDESAVLINIGTSGQLSFVEHKQKELSENKQAEPAIALGWERRPFVRERCLHVASTLCAGKSIALWVDFVENLVRTFCCKNDGTELDADKITKRVYDALKSLSFKEGDLQFNTQFYGSRSDPNVKASLQNISQRNFCFTDMSIALVEGIAEELHELWRIVPKYIHENKQRLYLTGGAFAIPIVQEIFTKRFAFDSISLLSEETNREDACIGAAQWACMSYRARH